MSKVCVLILNWNGWLQHNVGFPVHRRLLHKSITVTNHSPLRRYYSTRNRVALYKRYLGLRAGWVFADMFTLVKEIAKIAFFEKDRPTTFCCMIKGFFHGLIGRMGPHA